MAVALLPVTAFGAAFGATASAEGLSTTATIAMSALVFAGASQFAILDEWQTRSLVGIGLLVLAINSRHAILGATLKRSLWQAPLPTRLVAMSLLSDANWASTRRAVASGPAGIGHLIGGGLTLWLGWVAGTALGVALHGEVHDTGRLGIDVLMPALFACMLIDGSKRSKGMPAWVFAALAVAGLSIVAPSYWAVLAAAAIGTGVAAVRDARA